MKRNIKLVLSYDGSLYLGWQKTKTGPSIEETLQQVLEKILQESITLQAASRTDAGVHAEEQVVNFLIERDSLDLTRLHMSANQLLPGDIRILSLEEVALSFHPTLDSFYKEYHYYVSTNAYLSPFKRYTFWHYPKALDRDLMLLASSLLIGKKDFKAFTNVKKETTDDTIREIFSIDIEETNGDFCFKIQGDRFLYKMVRNIVGTLCYIGSHRLSLDDIEKALTLKDRKLIGMTAPASGLVLKRIYYLPEGKELIHDLA